MIRGEGTAVVRGVTPEDVFDFVLDPAQYTKADTKIVWVTKLADIPGGMLAREDGTFLGRFHGSVVTRYHWSRPTTIDVTLEHGVPRSLHAWFEIEAVDGGTRVRHDRTLTATHTLWAMLGVLPPEQVQRPHRHQSIALDLIVDCRPGCFTLVGEALGPDGDIVDATRVEREAGGVFVTPPGLWHSHHNESGAPAHLLPVQDAGLHTYLRTLDIRFTGG